MYTEDNEPPKELQNKKTGSTNFKQCGWCKHASGSHRFNYCIEGKCQLSKEFEREITWNTKCKFINISENEIDAMIKNKEYYIKDSENSILTRKEQIKILNNLKKKSIKGIPPLPDNRNYDHFNIEDEIAVYIQNENKWYFGNVKEGYRHHDGCVSYRLNGYGPQEANDKIFPFERGFFGNGCSIPYVMLKSEYDYFKKYKKHYEMWCKKAYDKLFNGTVLNVIKIQ